MLAAASGAVKAVLAGQRRLQLCGDMRQRLLQINHIDRVDRRVVQQPHISIGIRLAGCARSTGAFALAANELVDRARLRIPHDGGSPTLLPFLLSEPPGLVAPCLVGHPELAARRCAKMRRLQAAQQHGAVSLLWIRTFEQTSEAERGHACDLIRAGNVQHRRPQVDGRHGHVET
eukprot:scaffold47358_cov66-Phaeocystis_antarctica.AAC.3